MSDDSYTVLVVDDDEDVVDLFESWLSDHYTVKTATDGEDALAELEGVDVALLDRRLPTCSGDHVAAEIDRRDGDCMTAIVSGVEPDTDIVHVSCGEYLVKPIDESELLDTVDRLRQRARYDDRLAECANLAAKRGALEASQPQAKLERDPEYVDLCRQITKLRTELDDLTREFDAEDFRAAFETPDFRGGSRIQQVGWLS
ncbi:HalX domain-containing protein [Halobacteria archaeon AArc-m2/3/4]|uniref:HalX domain-containing protein n=1 Tax=Natronoglomus mannanivorans TaxID=2979990 RepID=A0AAP3E2N4_9EURY|nr:HalX domain-containing protein [Halobacteria archaeon AArc-xg1-1]MCU4971309.1 HalX domain-containing protein [Halobacteria archaeon AArc-m2/3/4]